jgi:23S rRNA (cytosine1962-C5)-methyltransferase
MATDWQKSLLVAFEARRDLLDPEQPAALRLFNGFYEGCPELVADLYGRTLVLFGYGRSDEEDRARLQQAQDLLLQDLPWLECVIWKIRRAKDRRLRQGIVSFGANPAQAIRENGVWYAVDLLMNQDASFYLDTRLLRRWLLEKAHGWQVLNMFAYTGSLGVAALAGGAAQVVQVDHSRKFLALADRSLELNSFEPERMELQATDFFKSAAAFRHQDRLFDCVLLDPPYFSTTRAGRVDMATESARLINKVRPLVADGGWLVVINNALFLTGAAFKRALQELAAEGYLELAGRVNIPEDVTGFPVTRRRVPPADPAPFNHPTKIALLRVRRKD